MKNCPTLSSSELLSAQESSSSEADIAHFKARHNEWGSFENKTLKNKFFGIHELKADLTENFRIAYNEAHMLHNMNICVALNGQVSLNLKESNFLTSLSSLKHHRIYAHETEYDLIIDRSVHVLHITVDREYYASLLHDSDRPSANIREKLLNKDRVWSGTGNVNGAMSGVVRDLLHNPLQGNLKALYTEAKVLELVALQLNDFNATPQLSQSKRPGTDDIFYDLRAYLDQHFCDDLSLHALSRMFGINEFKLKKGFKATFNATVFEYIHELKMIHARMLLQDEKRFVSEVAGVVGYKNPNHFSTAFKRKFGISPKELK